MNWFCKHDWEIVVKRYCPSFAEQLLATGREGSAKDSAMLATYLVLVQCRKCSEVRILKETAP